jgi:hypothetical protein
MSGDGVLRALVQCDGATLPPRRAADTQIERLALATSGRDRSLEIDLANLAACALSAIRNRAADLVRIAAYVYAADQALSRGGPADVYLRRWRRELTLCIQVTEPDYWGQPHVTDRLSELLHYLTEDTWNFVFTLGPPAIRQIPLGLQDPVALTEPDSVLLFSGGADSLRAAVEAVGGRRGRPVLVSHQPAPSHFAQQQRLVHALKERFSVRGFHHLGFSIHRRGGDAVDSTQRSRPFLFASLGSAVAGELNLPTVLLADNGMVGLGLPINESTIGTQTSRSAHPKFLALFNAFIKDLFPTPVSIDNPFGLRTRTEVLTQLQAHGCPELLQLTESCSRARGLPAAQRHCGTCSQCVDRRFGSVAAGLERHDPASRYRVDIFKDPLLEGTDRTVAVYYVRLARKLYSATPDDLFLEHGQLFEAVSTTGGTTLADAHEVAGLLHRHGQAVIQALGQMIERYKDELASDTLPDTCLLQLVIGKTRLDEPATGDSKNICRLLGDRWELRFEGKPVYIENTKGMRCLARLLWAPGQVFLAAVLEAEDVPAPTAKETSIKRVSAERAEAEGLRVGKPKGLGPRDDRVAEAAYRARADELEAMREDARTAGDVERVVELGEELEELKRRVAANRGKGGRLRPMADPGEQARDRVRKAINAAIDRILAGHAQLGQHLKASVTRSYECVYRPGAPIEWQQ